MSATNQLLLTIVLVVALVALIVYLFGPFTLGR